MVNKSFVCQGNFSAVRAGGGVFRDTLNGLISAIAIPQYKLESIIYGKVLITGRHFQNVVTAVYRILSYRCRETHAMNIY